MSDIKCRITKNCYFNPTDLEPSLFRYLVSKHMQDIHFYLFIYNSFRETMTISHLSLLFCTEYRYQLKQKRSYNTLFLEVIICLITILSANTSTFVTEESNNLAAFTTPVLSVKIVMWLSDSG